MRNYIYYLGMLVLTAITSFLIYIYILSLEIFFRDLFIHVILYFTVLVFSALFIHYLKTFFFIFMCKKKKIEYIMICLYPFVYAKKKLKLMLGPSNYVFFKNLCTVDFVSLDDVDKTYYLIEKINKKNNLVVVIVCVILFIVGIYFKLYLLIFPLFSYFMFQITTDFLKKYKNEETVLNKNFFDELLFSDIVNDDLIKWHISFFEENIEHLYKNPNEMLNFLKLFITLKKYALNKYVYRLDDIVKTLILEYGRSMEIECIDLIFDYIDLRICLENDDRMELLELLELFSNFYNWDFQIIYFYENRINEIKTYLTSTSNIKIRRKIYENIISFIL